jgi:molybdopterin converting factor small subunit
MSIKLFLPASLSNSAKCKDWFEVNGKTVGECLDQLVSLVPALKNVLFSESGDRLSWTFKVLVNQDSADAEGLATKLEDGDEIQVKTTLH